jgi:hypothetical protein
MFTAFVCDLRPLLGRSLRHGRGHATVNNAALIAALELPCKLATVAVVDSRSGGNPSGVTPVSALSATARAANSY